MATKAPPEITVDLALLLSQASHALVTEVTAGLEEVGISARGHCVLAHGLKGDLTQGQLAEECGLDKTTMVVTIDELERAGLAERRPASTDRRARIITVTEAGERVVAEGQEIIARIYGDVLGALPAREQEAFVDALTRLATGRLSTAVACERPPRRRAARAAR
ncbi:MAG: MarR family winged helix-turn-helix transcriptional regulator [Acidimicrobiales bacterium]